MMQLFNSKLSPYGRKVLIAAHAMGLGDKITEVATNPRADDATLRPKNPLGKIPTLLTDDGQAIGDSLAIIFYLHALHHGADHRPSDFLPLHGVDAGRTMFHHAIADGICNAAVLMAQNRMRKEENSGIPLDDTWIKRQEMAVNHGIDFMDKNLELVGDKVNLVTVTLVVALDYLDFRFPDWGWRPKHPKLAKWLDTMEKAPAIAHTVKPA